jgi:hypothetical protein
MKRPNSQLHTTGLNDYHTPFRLETETYTYFRTLSIQESLTSPDEEHDARIFT